MFSDCFSQFFVDLGKLLALVLDLLRLFGDLLLRFVHVVLLLIQSESQLVQGLLLAELLFSFALVFLVEVCNLDSDVLVFGFDFCDLFFSVRNLLLHCVQLSLSLLCLCFKRLDLLGLLEVRFLSLDDLPLQRLVLALLLLDIAVFLDQLALEL